MVFLFSFSFFSYECQKIHLLKGGKASFTQVTFSGAQPHGEMYRDQGRDWDQWRIQEIKHGRLYLRKIEGMGKCKNMYKFFLKIYKGIPKNFKSFSCMGRGFSQQSLTSGR